MKKRALSKRFDLNKTTVANLTEFEKERVLAGGDDRCEFTYCYASNSAVWKSSSVYYASHTAYPISPNPRYWPCLMDTTIPATDNPN